MTKKFVVRAPSNIALIKYMGKSDVKRNLPENSSLSMTLNALCTYVEIEATPAILGSGMGETRKLDFLPTAPSVTLSAETVRLNPALSLRVPELKGEGRAKVLRHVERVESFVKEVFPKFGIEVESTPQSITLRSANTFPEASGIASSASAFAAITLAVAAVCAKDQSQFAAKFQANLELKRELAKISRQGSGSSCRSFEGDFVRWSGEDTVVVENALPELHHFVILINESQKSVSSSEAHVRVKTSPLWEKRTERVEARLVKLQTALETGDLKTVALETWSEAWEMHSLFHTCEKPFTYWKGGTVDALNWISEYVYESDVPPIVTLDAGPNLHVIVPEKDAAVWQARFTERFGAKGFLQDQPGKGATFA